jgi:hypothetical protein
MTPASNQLLVINRCSWFTGRLATGCYERLRKTLNVITNGSFARTCSQLAQPQSRRRGGRSFNGPLITFS